MNTTTKVLGAAAIGGALYLLLKPKDASAEEKAPTGKQKCPDGSIIDAKAICPPKIEISIDPVDLPILPITTKCPDGSKVLFGQPCPSAPGACKAAPINTNTLPAPIISVLANGQGTLTPGLALPFALNALPAGSLDLACAPNPSDAFIYVQAWDAASGFQPVFPDAGGVAPPAAIAHSDAVGGKGVDRAQNALLVMFDKNSYISNYFDPDQNSQYDRMTAPGTFVLVWSTDRDGKPLAWWLTNWFKPNPGLSFTLPNPGT